LLKNIQTIFNSQGISVDNKHLECIVRYMMRKVEIVDAGDSKHVVGEQIEYTDFVTTLKETTDAQPIASPVLLGITRAASMDSSFIKSASFQEAHKIFVQAALSGQIDTLRGMKQRLITGQLIPAGTGYVATEWEREYTKDHGHEYFAKTVNDEMIEEFQPEIQIEILPEEPPVV